MRILDRYIVKELLGPLIFGVAMFTAILLGAVVLPQAAKLLLKGGSGVEILAIFMLSLPGIVVLTVPMAMLLGGLLGFGRLSSDAEVVAALASGVSLRRLAAPVIAAALVIVVLDFGFQEKVVPRCNQMARAIVERILSRSSGVSDRSLVTVFPDPNQGPTRLLAHASKLKLGGKGTPQERTLIDVTVVYLSDKGEPEVLTYAREARFDPKRQRFRLIGVRTYYLPNRGGAAGQPSKALPPLEAQENWVDLGKPEDLGRESKSPEDLSIAELRGAIRSRLVLRLAVAPYELELHRRFATPFAAVVFALMAVPLGLRRQRTGSSLGLGLSVMIIFFYYMVWQYLGTVGKGGAFDPMLAAWLPNLIGLAVGATLLQRAPK